MAQGKDYVHMNAFIKEWSKRLGWLGQSKTLTSSHDVADIIDVVSNVTGVSHTELLSRRRERQYVRARHIAIHLMIEMTDLSFLQIGSALNRDHTTVIYVKKKMENRGRGRSLLNTQLAEAKRRLAA